MSVAITFSTWQVPSIPDFASFKMTKSGINDAVKFVFPFTLSHRLCDSAEPDRIKMWRKAGYRARAVVKNPNSIQSQIDWLKGRKIHIHPSCVNVIKEIQQWRWRVDEKSDEYTDEPVNVFDDAMAALRYGVESWRKDKKAKIYSREEYGI